MLVRVVCKVDGCFRLAVYCSSADIHLGNSDERAYKKR